MALLEVRNLTVAFPTARGELVAVDGLDLDVAAGDLVGIVGESGSGKSVASLAVLGLVPFPGRVTADRLAFDGRDLGRLSPAQRRALVGKDMAMVFQEPMTSLNPCYSVGFQITEMLAAHESLGRAQRRARAVELLRRVGIPSPAARLDAYPHQLSGGMCQRVMIAMAIACHPRLLIADEPTTALDVTIQAQILDLLLDLQAEQDMALVLITHDMGVIAETVRRVVVMYAGQAVEQRDVARLFAAPRHPYTAALLDALPERALGRTRLVPIPGMVPALDAKPAGCLFHPRCRFADAACRASRPPLVPDGAGAVRCLYPRAVP
ncbi:MAG: ABC transporter ATP-binding protein [Alphaproteobacteria bacterium]